MKNLSLVMIAAGMSSRMGTVKQLLPVNENLCCLEYALSKYLSSDFFEIKLVLGYKKEEIENKLSSNLKKLISVVYNPYYRSGVGTSVSAGVAALSSESDACMFALADMPYIDSRFLDEFIVAWRKDPDKILAPYHKGKRGNPVIFPKTFYAVLSRLSGDKGGRDLLSLYPESVIAFDTEHRSILKDLDVMEDWNAFKNTVKRGDFFRYI